MDPVVIGIQGLIYVVLMFGFLTLFKRLRKQPIVFREIMFQAVLGGVIFMTLLGLLGSVL